MKSKRPSWSGDLRDIAIYKLSDKAVMQKKVARTTPDAVIYNTENKKYAGGNSRTNEILTSNSNTNNDVNNQRVSDISSSLMKKERIKEIAAASRNTLDLVCFNEMSGIVNVSKKSNRTQGWNTLNFDLNSSHEQELSPNHSLVSEVITIQKYFTFVCL